MSADGPWLDDEQQLAWRGWLAVSGRLPAALHRRLQADSGLSLSDFEVLVQLSESPEERLRFGELAAALLWERSRLSHHIKRMAGRGLVAREECADDGRGAFVVLTPQGRGVIELAAPAHARAVRELVFDTLTENELRSLRRITGKVLTRLSARE